MVTSGFVSSAEVTDVINDELCELYDLLVSEYVAAETTITTTSQILVYTLPGDFRTLLAVYADEGGGKRRVILPANEHERALYTAPQDAYDVIVKYVPTAPVLSLDDDTFDGVSGWDSLITARVARRLLQKRKTETSSLDAEIAQLEQRVRSVRRRDLGNARRVTDIEEDYSWPYADTVQVRAYMLVGDNIELYQPAGYYP